MVNGGLPDGWAWQTVDDLSKNIQYGYTESANAEPIGPKFLRITDIQDGKVDWDTVPYCECSDDEAGKYLLESGDIVFARTGATTGKSFLINNPPKAVFASYLIRLRLQEEINKKYFSYFLDSPDYWSQIMQVRKGSAQPGVNATILAKLNVPVAPLPEQERIVAKIEELFTQLEAGTSALERVQAGLRRYKASVLKAAIEGKLAQNGNGKVKSGDLLEGWRLSTLPEIGHLGRGKSKHRPRNAEFLYGGKYPFIQTGDIRHADGVITSYTQTYSEAGLAQSKLWKKGTLCITIAANIAETAILGIDACFPDSVVGFIPNNDVDVKFVEFYIRTIKDNLERYAPATAQKNINLDVLQKVEIPLPPLEEQRRIVAEVERRLSVARQVENSVEEALMRASRLRQAVLRSAFEGRLTS